MSWPVILFVVFSVLALPALAIVSLILLEKTK